MDGDSADPSGRDWTRVGLVAGCLLATIVVTLLMPAFAVDGLAGSPLERVLPGESADPNPGAGSGAGGSLGALNPGAGTGVGGDIGLNSETFGSTSTEVHFTVESSQRTYWRTAAYGTYTGSGWERSTDTDPVEGSIDHPGPDGERIDYEVTLKQRASAVPTAYRPALIDGIDDPQVTDNGAIQPGSTLDAGTTIEGVSFAPQADVDRLRSTDESYPSEIEQRYTQLPDGTPDRIESKTAAVFDDANADDPYEKAAAVQEYLRSSKEYSLDVGERDNSIADTFIFEMDAGYCEYFATSMAVMLRSQDIPTRYVVGYSSGQRVGPDTYEVRGMNAHAWVEVYFEGVGWVRFDPTPGNERLETQQEALDDLEGDFDIGEAGSPGEQFTPGEGGGNSGEQLQQGLQTSLNRTAVPGTAVELTVTYDDTPVRGVEVLFNGESVGITDPLGRVVGEVPDAEELTVEIRKGDGTTPDPLADVLFGSEEGEFDDGNLTTESASTQSIRVPGGAAPSAATFAAGQQTKLSASPTPAQIGTDQPQDTHPIDRTASVVIDGEPVPGGEVLLTARIDDVVIDDAVVTVDGETVGRTNESGQLVIELPDRSGDVSVEVERELVSGQRTITVPELTMSVETGVLGPNSFGSATITAKLDGVPAAGVPVLVGGEEVAVTGPNGTAQVSLPFTHATTIAIEASGQTETTNLTGLLYLPLGVGVGLVTVVSVVGYALRRRGIDWLAVGTQLRGGVTAIVTGLRRGFVALVTDGNRYVAGALRRIWTALVMVAGVFTGSTSVSELWRRTSGRIAATTGAIAAVVRSRGSAEHSRSGAELTVREAWNRFLDSISANSATTQTPGELARHAIEEDGLPEQPVVELRDTFREVEYGSRNASDRLERVQRAIEQIEQEGER
ncbi:transglutaminase TgpA family protein [Halovenus sp. HT40]|uniref:transglutaminase TgpA family protein n=1 Tax=Halovenus sp. HT40 TaxID=3126691 RepID=UPI00300F3CDD